MNSYGSIEKILSKIREAKTPERFTQDFLATGLSIPGGSRQAFIPLSKRLGLLSSDGTPTELYKAFRNPSQSGVAIADAMRRGYAKVFAKNEFAFKLDKNKLQGLITEITGLPPTHGTVRAIVGTFEALKKHADFEAGGSPAPEAPATANGEEPPLSNGPQRAPSIGTGVNLSYTLYLNLPNTDDIGVFNAIFRSLRENLLK